MTLVTPVCGPRLEQHWPRPPLSGLGAVSKFWVYSPKRPTAFALKQPKELNDWLLTLAECPRTLFASNRSNPARRPSPRSPWGAHGRLPGPGPGSWTCRETRVRTAAHSERPGVHVLVLCCHRYARLQDWDSFHEFSSRAKNLVPRRTPTALYYEGISRYMEGEVLYLQKQIEGQSENAQDSGVELLKVSPG